MAIWNFNAVYNWCFCCILGLLSPYLSFVHNTKSSNPGQEVFCLNKFYSLVLRIWYIINPIHQFVLIWFQWYQWKVFIKCISHFPNFMFMLLLLYCYATWFLYSLAVTDCGAAAACASNQILHLSLYGGNCRGCGGESAETGLIIIRQDALCLDSGLSQCGANPKSNALSKEGWGERVTIHGHMPTNQLTLNRSWN